MHYPQATECSSYATKINRYQSKVFLVVCCCCCVVRFHSIASSRRRDATQFKASKQANSRVDQSSHTFLICFCFFFIFFFIIHRFFFHSNDVERHHSTLTVSGIYSSHCESSNRIRWFHKPPQLFVITFFVNREIKFHGRQSELVSILNSFLCLLLLT